MHSQLNNVSIYNLHVKEYINKFMDLSLYKDTFDLLLHTLPPDSTVLELGCGPANVMQYLKAKRADLQLTGIDLAPHMIEAAKEANPDAAFKLMDLRKAGELDTHFDAVLAPFCFPYLPAADIPEVMAQMKKLTMVKQGMIYLSCMEGATEKSGYERTCFTGINELYIIYFSRHEIECLLKDNGFEIIAFYTKDYPEADGSITTDLIYIAKQSKSK